MEKIERLNLRLTALEAAELNELAKLLGTTKTTAVITAVRLSLRVKKGGKANGEESTNA